MTTGSAYGPALFDEPFQPAASRIKVPYPPLERVGVIGDRRSAAVVAADGTIAWLCWPDFDSPPILASLLDDENGGFWRVGPHEVILGRQRYAPDTAILHTGWSTAGSAFELTDAMPLPESERSADRRDSRSVIRRLRCLRGEGWCRMDLRPRDDFGAYPHVGRLAEGAEFRFPGRNVSLWCSVALELGASRLGSSFFMREGEEAWFVLSLGDQPLARSAEAAASLMQDAEDYWRKWAGSLSYLGPRRERVRRSAITFNLLSYAPTGALVAAPTASLPERIGGDRNYDYRYAWVRDVSLTLAIMSVLGDLAGARRYMDWLSGLSSDSELPLQVLYRIDGSTRTETVERTRLEGYRRSRPVRFGNGADRQYQLDSLGYLADCALIYLQQGGKWRPEYWEMIRRIADHVASSWQRPTNGIWEQDPPQHFVTDKVMAWVALERALKIAGRVGVAADLAPWKAAMRSIRSEVLDRGWSSSLGAFRQRYEADTLDASVLLMALMGFLPADDPRMRSTIAAIESRLTRGGFAYRFDPQAQAEPLEQPLGEAEGAFLPCTFWLAAVRAMLGEPDEAEAILNRVEGIAGDVGFFAEQVDPSAMAFLGNVPLLFSHAAYVKAVMEIAKAKPLASVGLQAGQAVGRVRNLLHLKHEGRGAR